jgi:hypothetical protein
MKSITKKILTWSVILVVAFLWLPAAAMSAGDELKELKELPTVDNVVPDTEKAVNEASGYYQKIDSNGIQIDDALYPVSPGFSKPSLKKGDFVSFGLNKDGEIVEIWKSEPEE